MATKQRPGFPEHLMATPRDAAMFQWVGGYYHDGVSVTKGQYAALNRLYGLHKELAMPVPPAPPPATQAKRSPWDPPVKPPKPVDPEEVRAFMQAGADRNMFRHADADGLRLVAWLAKFIEPGKDPLKALILLASDAGWDVDPEDFEWASNEEIPEEAEA